MASSSTGMSIADPPVPRLAALGSADPNRSPIVVHLSDPLAFSMDETRFSEEAARRCQNLLRHAEDYSSYRLVFTVAKNRTTHHAELLNFALERDPTEWFGKRRMLLPATPVDLPELDTVFGDLLADCDKYEDLNRGLLQQELAAFHGDDVAPQTHAALLPAIFQRFPICWEGNDCMKKGDHWNKYMHVDRCQCMLAGVGETSVACGFCVSPELDVLAITSAHDTDFNPQLANTLKNCGYTLYLRAQLVPELLLAPSVKMCNTQHVGHTNSQLCTETDMWKVLRSVVLRIETEYDTLPMTISINFGKWESAVAYNHRSIKIECHGHIHLLYPRRAVNTINFLRNRTTLPEMYRQSNIDAMRTAKSRYESRLRNAQYVSVNGKIQELNDKVGQFIQKFENLDGKVEKLSGKVDEILKLLRVTAEERDSTST
jgi:hypothetical protein